MNGLSSTSLRDISNNGDFLSGVNKSTQAYSLEGEISLLQNEVIDNQALVAGLEESLGPVLLPQLIGGQLLASNTEESTSELGAFIREVRKQVITSNAKIAEIKSRLNIKG